jgi:hypothetical protein
MNTRCYENITKEKIESLINALKANDATITGDNPWSVDTHKYSIKLIGKWDESSLIMEITLVSKAWYVPSQKVWYTLDELIGDYDLLG